MSNNWFAGKLGTPQPPVAPTHPYTPPQPVPYNPVPQQPVPGEVPQRLPDSAQISSRCPNCGSGNYGGVVPEGSMSGMAARAKCYDCGYPIVQSGSGIGKGISQPGGGPAIPARQSTTANNFNPQGIIGHI